MKIVQFFQVTNLGFETLIKNNSKEVTLDIPIIWHANNIHARKKVVPSMDNSMTI
jgi:hypothetical protein